MLAGSPKLGIFPTRGRGLKFLKFMIQTPSNPKILKTPNNIYIDINCIILILIV